MIPYGKTFYKQTRRQSVHHYDYKKASPTVNKHEPSSDSINTVITHLLKTVPQEYTVLEPEKRYQKCVNYFAELFKQGNDDPRSLPRTIIYTSTYRQAYSLSLCMEQKFNIPSLYAPATATDEELKNMLVKCRTKEFPILIFESRTFEQSVDNIDLVINYNVPSTIEEYGRRLACIEHKKCITFVVPDEDRQFLRKVLDILKESHQKPPQSLEALFAFDTDNLERYIREFKTAESWIDLVDMD